MPPPSSVLLRLLNRRFVDLGIVLTEIQQKELSKQILKYEKGTIHFELSDEQVKNAKFEKKTSRVSPWGVTSVALRAPSLTPHLEHLQITTPWVNTGWVIFRLSFPEEKVNLDHLRPYYKLASHNVHANPKGIFFRLGILENIDDLLPAGPSDLGMTEPGHSMALSLGDITVQLLKFEHNIDTLVISKMLLELQDEVGEALYDAHKSIISNR